MIRICPRIQVSRSMAHVGGVTNNSVFTPVYNPHSKPQYNLTLPQLTLFFVWFLAIFTWLLRYAHNRVTNDRNQRRHSVDSATGGDDVEPQISSASSLKITITDTAEAAAAAAARGGATMTEGGNFVAGNDGENWRHIDAVCGRKDAGGKGVTEPETAATVSRFTWHVKKDGKDEKQGEVSPSIDDCLKNVLLLGLLMAYFYLCDYRKVFPEGDRVYNRDTFLFLVLVLLFVGCLFTVKRTPDKILNRDQTEEWKGWMQVMFVWYHYFAAKEWYNWIRVFIACYVWMTGFGNFSFFWTRKDYSLWRVFKMLFRLDFSVIVICATVSNAYVVYYICAMHTYWFLSVYVTMAAFSSLNGRGSVMALKFAAYALFNAIVFDLPGTGRYVFRPLSFVLGLQPGSDVSIDSSSSNLTATYSDDGDDGVLHEWLFRTRLDHWSCLVGMLCAYGYPKWDSFVRRLESNRRRVPVNGIPVVVIVKSIIVIVSVAVFAAWYGAFVTETNKLEYNRRHPYASPLPIVVYIVVRNLWPTLRTRYVGLFAWLGKVTLETYLCQLHVYLQSNARKLIVYVDTEHYPMVNFLIATAVYVFVSVRLFNVTSVLSSFFLPPDSRLLIRRCSVATTVVILSASLAIICKRTTSPATYTSR